MVVLRLHDANGNLFVACFDMQTTVYFENKTLQRSSTMNDTDKIILMIEGLASQISKMDAKFEKRFDVLEKDVAELKVDVAGLKVDVARIDAGLQEVKTGLTEVKVIIENETERNIGFIAEGHLDTTRKLNKMQPAIDRLEKDMAVVKAAITGHSVEIAKIREFAR